MRNAANERNVERVKRGESRILRLSAAGSGEEAERGVVAKPSIHSERWRDAPGIFQVKAEPAKTLRECAVASFRVVASCIRKRCGGAMVIGDKLSGVGEIEGRILGELDEVFGRGRERAAKDGFVDEIDAEAKYMAAGRAENVVAKLIFLLIADSGKGGNFSSKLIVAERFEAGSSVKIRAEGKSQGKVEI